MDMKSLVSTIASELNGTMVRTGKQNFIAIPTGETNADGNPTYFKVAVSKLLATDTKVNKAFDFDSAVEAYTAWQTEQESEEKPAKVKVAKVNEEAVAKRKAQDDALVAWMEVNAETDKWYTATELMASVPEFDGMTVMAVGSCAIRCAEDGAIAVKRDENGKRVYAKLA